MPKIKKILLIFIPFLILLSVVFYTPPPKTWQEASVFQILSFFLPLLTFLTFFLNLFIKYLPKSFALSLGLMLLLVFKAGNKLSLVTAILILLVFIILAAKFKAPKIRQAKKSLTTTPKIPTLSRFKSRKE